MKELGGRETIRWDSSGRGTACMYIVPRGEVQPSETTRIECNLRSTGMEWLGRRAASS